ncbi:hypothetical protein FACS189485_08550 [Spirochaetia bacterium]|nr:hypothetical protein FACS189485_08550 [Spirochaetia bacterium]
MLYKGRKKSHRFSILNDGAFEYDCILNKEPDSNIVTLTLDGTDQFDFFRQPDFVPDPFLKGSYAVYKKETLIGEGTGKLCHIHRPKIIDSQGRWVWGDLSIIGDRLLITIPETWLVDAAYPVIVDPVVGTSTIGSQTTWYDPDNESTGPVFVEEGLIVNRFLVPEPFNGSATACVYAWYDDYYGRCQPILYSDSSNAPLTRKSAFEGNFDIAVSSSKAASWRVTSFKTKESISGGTYLWYGLFSDFFAVRFDYGQKCYWDYWIFVGDEIPNTYPIRDINWYFDFKVSMYFSYTVGQNYSRTLTQGVTLTDTRKLTAAYKKTLIMNGGNMMSLGHGSSYYRKSAVDVKTNDNRIFTMSWLRYLMVNAAAFGSVGRLGNYIRGLYTNAGGMAETGHLTTYYRKQEDTAYTEAVPLRHLIMVIRLVTVSFVRDFILKRFLKSNEDIVLKSPVCREIEFDSRIH